MFGVETTTTSQSPLSRSSRCPEKTFSRNKFTKVSVLILSLLVDYD